MLCCVGYTKASLERIAVAETFTGVVELNTHGSRDLHQVAPVAESKTSVSPREMPAIKISLLSRLADFGK